MEIILDKNSLSMVMICEKFITEVLSSFDSDFSISILPGTFAKATLDVIIAQIMVCIDDLFIESDCITKTGLVNLDFADIKTIMSNGGVAMIGVGESDTESRAQEAVEKALNNPLLDVDISGASGALVNISGGPDMTLDEAKKVVETVSEKLEEDSRIIWGAQIYEDLERTIRVMLIVTGVKSPQIFGPQRGLKDKRKSEMENEFGIDFID